MKLANFGVRCLIDDLAGDMELRALGIKVKILDANLEGQMYSCRCGGASILDCGHATNGAGAEKVTRPDQIVCMPLYHNLYELKFRACSGLEVGFEVPCPQALRGAM